MEYNRPAYRTYGLTSNGARRMQRTTARGAPAWPFSRNVIDIGIGAPQCITPELESTSEPALGHDSSTNNLIRRYRKLREEHSYE